MQKTNLTDPIPLQCWSEYWEAKYLIPRIRLEMGNDNPEVLQLALRVKLFEQTKNITA